MEVNGQLHAPAALSPGKELPVPTGYEVRWAPEPVWMLWRRENLLPLPRIEFHPSNLWLIVIPTELSWFLILGRFKPKLNLSVNFSCRFTILNFIKIYSIVSQMKYMDK
jgi:hypothetical protein